MELSFENINEAKVFRNVEINPFFRYYSVFKELLEPNAEENREIIADVHDLTVYHLIASYYGEVSDITEGSVYYYSPNLQAELHKNNPSLYKEYPVFLDEPVELVKIEELSNSDDFDFYRYE